MHNDGYRLMMAQESGVQSTDYGQNANNMVARLPTLAAMDKLRDTPQPPLAWAPPIITEDLKPRVATQADIDRLVRVEALYKRMLEDMRAHVKHADGDV